MRVWIVGTAMVALGVARPAVAAMLLTFNFGGAISPASVASVSRTVAGKTLTATARRFTAAPGTLTSLSQTSAAGTIRTSAPGIGVTGGGDTLQIDTNSAAVREAILLSSGTPNFSLYGLKLSLIDRNDTLQVYGVNDDSSLVSLDFTGAIKSSLGGASVVNTSANSGTSVLTLDNPTAYFSRYLFTTRVGGDANYMGDKGQGYRIDGVTGAVPEPATWAMLIVGFGLVGIAARRGRRVVAS